MFPMYISWHYSCSCLRATYTAHVLSSLSMPSSMPPEDSNAPPAIALSCLARRRVSYCGQPASASKSAAVMGVPCRDSECSDEQPAKRPIGSPDKPPLPSSVSTFRLPRRDSSDGSVVSRFPEASTSCRVWCHSSAALSTLRTQDAHAPAHYTAATRKEMQKSLAGPSLV